MKGKQLLLLLLLVVVLGGAGYLLLERNELSWSGTNTGAGGKVLQFPINDVAQVHVKAAGGDLNLVKKDEQWTVQERANYPANFEQVGGFLRKLWDLKTVQEVKVGPSKMAHMELVEPGQGDGAGTLVEFKDTDGKTVGGVLLGKKHMRSSQPGPMGDMGGFPSGRYVMPLGGKKVSLVSETFEDAVPQPERWLQKDFLKVENPKAITLEGQTEAMRWKLTRETATSEWKLADATTKPVESKPGEPKAAEPATEAKPADPAAPADAKPADAKPADAKPADAKPADAKPAEQLDTAKVSAFATLFSNPSFKDVLAADAKVEETGLDKPATATIETFDGFTYTLKIGKLMNEAYPVQFTVAANLAKERTPGKDEKPEDKTKLDEEFKTTQKRLEDKLAAEKKFEGRTYLLEKFTVEPLLKDRSALLAEKKPEPAPGTPPAPGAPVPTITPGAPPAPKTSATTPPISVTTPPISVTTPPVSVTTPPVSVTTPPVSAPPMKPTPGAPAPAAPTPGAPVPIPPLPTPAKPSPGAPPAPTPPKPSPDAPVRPPAPAPPKPAPDAPGATPPVPVPPPAKPDPAPPAPAPLPPPLPPLPGESPAPKPPAPAPQPPPPAPAEPAPPAQ